MKVGDSVLIEEGSTRGVITNLLESAVEHMRHLHLALSLLLLTGCDTVIDDKYKSFKDAEQDGAFERRWPPDIVPTSAHDIRIRGIQS